MNLVTIGELCELKYGKGLRKDLRVDGDVPVFGSNGIVGYHNEAVVQKPTIVVGRKGSIGEVHFVDGPSWPIDTTYFVELLDQHQVDMRWFYRVLSSLRLSELNRAAAVPGLNRDDVYRIEIPLPPLEDQKRIAYLLSRVEGLIAKRKQHLQQLDDLLKSVFHDMFGDPVRNEKGWDVKPLSEIASVRRGKFTPRPRNDPKYYGGVHPFIQTGDIARANGRLSEFSQTLNDLGTTVSRKFEVGTVVIAIVGATIGETAILELETYATDSVIGFNLKNPEFKSEPVFLEFVMRQWKPILRANAPEAARANINITTLNPIPIICPPPASRQKFCEFSERLQTLSSQYQKSIANLKNLQGILSQQAFSGQLDLTRVTVPVIITERHVNHDGDENDVGSTESLFELPSPTNGQKFKSSESRKSALKSWLLAYSKYLDEQPFEADSFIALVQQKLSDLESESDIEWYSHEIGVAEYDEVKKWIFEELEAKRLHQHYDDTTNRVRVSAAKE